ncbi:hypothetical protein TRVA0_042S01244 [Trichomonascus vanleenenianus]|uniref:cytochrome b5-like heme/steroid binding domain-containing protein n=1 Tax=Trichomonascus vanleenenianus TaxID=2268995 RepID=UPI003ECA8CB4
MPPEYLPYANYGLIILALFLLARKFLFTAEEDDGSLRSGPEPLVFTTYTPQTLSKFNGKDDERVLLAVKGTVFDVTLGKTFYGPGGPYANFGGRDASRGLAKNSFDEDMLTSIDQEIDTLGDLTPEERSSLEEWYTHFRGKYTICGELVNETDKMK